MLKIIFRLTDPYRKTELGKGEIFFFKVGLDYLIRVCNQNLILLFLNQNICCGYSEELSHRDGSYGHPKHTLRLIRKYSQFYAKEICKSGPVNVNIFFLTE